MARDKKKSFGIKTTRYFTKTCTNCQFEYPNWFTNCPKCGIAWDEQIDTIKEQSSLKKTIKIVVKITEEEFDQELERVILIFSADHGNSWFQMKMENKNEYFVVELAEVPTGSIIIYYIEVYLKNQQKIIENNDGKYYYYKVGSYNENLEEISDNKKMKIADNLKSTKKEYYKPERVKVNKKQKVKFSIPKNPEKYQVKHNETIFGKPITEVDPDLKICSSCSSKIKKMWSTCPICGKPT